MRLIRPRYLGCYPLPHVTSYLLARYCNCYWSTKLRSISASQSPPYSSSKSLSPGVLYRLGAQSCRRYDCANAFPKPSSAGVCVLRLSVVAT